MAIFLKILFAIVATVGLAYYLFVSLKDLGRSGKRVFSAGARFFEKVAEVKSHYGDNSEDEVRPDPMTVARLKAAREDHRRVAAVRREKRARRLNRATGRWNHADFSWVDKEGAQARWDERKAQRNADRVEDTAS